MRKFECIAQYPCTMLLKNCTGGIRCIQEEYWTNRSYTQGGRGILYVSQCIRHSDTNMPAQARLVKT